MLLRVGGMLLRVVESVTGGMLLRVVESEELWRDVVESREFWRDVVEGCCW